MESNQQIATFAITLATGAIIGLFFDFYRVTHNLVRPRRAVTYITDLLFWLIATAITFGVLLMSNWGELRAYVFIGLLSGAVLYFKLLSKLAQALLLQVFRAIHFAIVWTKRFLQLIIFRPLAWVLGWLLRPFRIVKRRTAAWCKDHFKKPPDENIPPE
ncbi:MAG: spore cortex biosynthesis protein YabQ [Veillonellaceae bacterium]|jgi:spore cortex biosynthesis protein YabQ|nr:spore cortex biosynthesis protein YabQ [Veillonellaceae bacterium]